MLLPVETTQASTKPGTHRFRLYPTMNRREETEKQIKGVKGALHKSFHTIDDALAWLHEKNVTIQRPATPTPRQEPPENPQPDVGLEPSPKKQKTETTVEANLSSSSIQPHPSKTDNSVWRGLDEDPNVQYIYTDGACSSNGTATGRAGIGIFHATNDPRNISARLPGPHQTNQRAELFAVLKALEQLYYSDIPTTAKGPTWQTPNGRHNANPQSQRKKVVIRTDSNYVIQAITVWSSRWETNGWRSRPGTPVVSKDLFKRARGMLGALADRGVDVRFEHVRGHMGVWGNEQADRLAVQGALMEDVGRGGGEWEEFEDPELDLEISEMIGE
jgi:ribonuclease HI